MKKEDLITLYFEGKLDAEQKARFEDLLRNDAEFKTQVDIENDVKTAIISVKKDNLRDKLTQLETPKKQLSYYKIAIAASLIIALGVFGILQNRNTMSNADVFAQYYEPYTNIIAPVSRGEDATDKKQEAFRHYDTRNYTVASKQFENLYTETKTSYYVFYQAICELQLNNTDKAIALLNTHKQFTDRLSSQTDWYLAMAYLKADNRTEAKKILQNIIEVKSYKHKAAKDILKKLN